MNTSDQKRWFKFANQSKICYSWNIMNYTHCNLKDESCHLGDHVCFYCIYNNRGPLRHQSKSTECPSQTENFNPNLGDSRKRTYSDTFTHPAHQMSVAAKENVRPAPSSSCPPALTAQNVYHGSPAATSAIVGQSARPSSHHASTELMHQGGDMSGSRGFQQSASYPSMSAAPHHGGNLGRSNNHQHVPPSALHQAGDGGQNEIQPQPLGQQISSDHRSGADPYEGGRASDQSNFQHAQTEYPTSWKPDYEKLHQTFGRQDEKNETVKNINPHQFVPRNLVAESATSIPLPSTRTQHPSDVDESISFRKFLEKENEMLKVDLKKERAEKDILMKENLELWSQLERFKAREEVEHEKSKGRTWVPYSRLHLPNLPPGFNSHRQPAHARNNQANQVQPQNEMLRDDWKIPRGAGPSLDPGQFLSNEDIVNVYKSSEEKENEVYHPETRRQHVENEKYLPQNQPSVHEMSFDVPPVRDLRREILDERRNGNCKKKLFDF